MSSDVTRVEKPWGYELHWAKTARYVGKLIHVKAGHALSLQYHKHKDESIYLLRGSMRLVLQDGAAGPRQEKILRAGDAERLPPLKRHRMEALSDCVVLEVSTPELDDVVRLEDRYGRT